jgi:hypothetical protein
VVFENILERGGYQLSRRVFLIVAYDVRMPSKKTNKTLHIKDGNCGFI